MDMSPYLVLLLIIDFFPVRFALYASFWVDSDVTKLLANLMPNCLYFILLSIVMCNFALIKIINKITFRTVLGPDYYHIFT